MWVYDCQYCSNGPSDDGSTKDGSAVGAALTQFYTDVSTVPNVNIHQSLIYCHAIHNIIPKVSVNIILKTPEPEQHINSMTVSTPNTSVYEQITHR